MCDCQVEAGYFLSWAQEWAAAGRDWAIGNSGLAQAQILDAAKVSSKHVNSGGSDLDRVTRETWWDVLSHEESVVVELSDLEVRGGKDASY